MALLFFSRETFGKKNFKLYWGSFYEGINIKKKLNVFNNLFFILRRLIFFLTVFFLQNYSSVQLIITIVVNLFMMMYQGYNNPFESKLKNKLNLFNEVCILLSSILFICFSEINKNLDAQYNMGWCLISLIIFNASINISVISYIGI
jgi:hypothetical protein